MTTDLKTVVRDKYGEAATRAAEGVKGNCCGTGGSCGPTPSPATSTTQ